MLVTQAALIDEASREARQLAAALDGTEAARCAPMPTARASGFGQLALRRSHSLGVTLRSVGEPRAISRLGRAGRLYRACFRPRCDSLLRLLAQQLSPLGARLVPQACYLVITPLALAASRRHVT